MYIRLHFDQTFSRDTVISGVKCFKRYYYYIKDRKLNN